MEMLHLSPLAVSGLPGHKASGTRAEDRRAPHCTAGHGTPLSSLLVIRLPTKLGKKKVEVEKYSDLNFFQFHPLLLSRREGGVPP